MITNSFQPTKVYDFHKYPYGILGFVPGQGVRRITVNTKLPVMCLETNIVHMPGVCCTLFIGTDDAGNPCQFLLSLSLLEYGAKELE